MNFHSKVKFQHLLSNFNSLWWSLKTKNGWCRNIIWVSRWWKVKFILSELFSIASVWALKKTGLFKKWILCHMGRIGDDYDEQNKPVTERYVSGNLLWGVEKKLLLFFFATGFCLAQAGFELILLCSQYCFWLCCLHLLSTVISIYVYTHYIDILKIILFWFSVEEYRMLMLVSPKRFQWF